MTIVVKGGPTVVVSPDADSPSDSNRFTVKRHINSSGNPGMATAGSGDVLTGIIASLLGQGLTPPNAARRGVYIHGLAGDFAAKAQSQAGMTCVEILECIPKALTQLGTEVDR